MSEQRLKTARYKSVILSGTASVNGCVSGPLVSTSVMTNGKPFDSVDDAELRRLM